MDTQDKSKCIICGSFAEEENISGKKSARLFRMWKYECAETVCCILFKHKIRNNTLLNHFRRASYCSICQRGIRDINLTWKLQKSLKAKIKKYSEKTKKLIKSNYHDISSSKDQKNFKDDNLVSSNDYYTVVKMVYREACGDETIEASGAQDDMHLKIEAKRDIDEEIEAENDDFPYNEYSECDNTYSPHQDSQCISDVQDSDPWPKFSCKKKRCRRKFSNESEMESHYLEKHNAAVADEPSQPRVQCPKCDKTLRNEVFLKDHLHRVHEDRPSCKFCGTFCENEEELLMHCSNFHQGPNPFSCAFCDAQCLCSTDLRKHTSEAHPDPERPKCGTCGKLFVTLQGMLIHERRHTDPKKCEICGKLFPNKHQLSRHVDTHSTLLTFLCPTCGKGFRTKKSYSVHLKTHDPMRTFSCIVCGKSFRSLAGCRSHEISHTAMKPHTCSICGKSFLNKYNMLAHEKIHSGDYKKRVRKRKSEPQKTDEEKLDYICL